jgi:hypothetical protein
MVVAPDLALRARRLGSAGMRRTQVDRHSLWLEPRAQLGMRVERMPMPTMAEALDIRSAPGDVS